MLGALERKTVNMYILDAKMIELEEQHPLSTTKLKIDKSEEDREQRISFNPSCRMTQFRA